MDKANYSIDDIRQIRDQNSKRHLNMTAKEIIEDTEKGAMEARKMIEEIRRKRIQNN